MVSFANFLDNTFVGEAIHDKVNNGHLKRDHFALDVSKASTGNLGGTLFVDPTASLANFVVVFWLKIKLGWLATNLGNFVLVFAETNRHIITRDVRDSFELS